MLQTHNIQCPYCWEQIEIVVDPSEQHQQYVEDCFVCCHPIHFDITMDEDNHPHIIAVSENEDY